MQVRFASIFSRKQRLLLEELEPYLEGLYGTGLAGVPKTKSELLALYTRTTTTSTSAATSSANPTYYSAK